MNSKRRPVVVSRRRGGRLELDVPAVPGWEGFDSILGYLQAHFPCEAVKVIDGPDARKAWLTVEGSKLEVEFEDVCGSSIIAPEPASEPVLKKIATDLERRFAE